MGLTKKTGAALAVIAVLAAAIVALVLHENLSREIALSDPVNKNHGNADHQAARFAKPQTVTTQGSTSKQSDPEAGAWAEETARPGIPSPQPDDCVPDDEFRFTKIPDRYAVRRPGC